MMHLKQDGAFHVDNHIHSKYPPSALPLLATQE